MSNNDNELLLAISSMMEQMLDQKLKAALQPVHEDIGQLKEDVRQLKTENRQSGEQLLQLRGDVTQLNQKVDLLRQKVDNIESKVDNLEQKVDQLELKVDSLDQKVGQLELATKQLREEIEQLNLRAANLEMTIENETNHNIQLLAENHGNLIDKLNQAIKVNDKTLIWEVQLSSLRLRIDKLEQEIANLKKDAAPPVPLRAF